MNKTDHTVSLWQSFGIDSLRLIPLIG